MWTIQPVNFMISKKLKYAALTLVAIVVGLTLFHRPILEGAGRFMAPISEKKADVLVLEGSTAIDLETLHAAVRLLSEGKGRRMVVVFLYPLDGRYPLEESRLIMIELERLGFGKDKAEVLLTPIPGHPITLSEAKLVTDKLLRDGVRGAIFLGRGFHTRRSVGLYRQEGAKMGLHVIPYAQFNGNIDGYGSNSWWQSAHGIGDFIEEAVKLVYYVGRGYLSPRYVWD
jgi:hypothetical protein